MNRKTFTLVEMLVVITIISILAGLLMPSLAKSLEAARGVNCRSNLKQMGACAAMYIGDNDGWTITAYRYNKFWFANFVTYYGATQQTFACPSETQWAYSAQRLGYGLNTTSFGETDSTGGKKLIPHRAAAFSQHGRDSRLAMIIDTPPVVSAYSSIRNTSANSVYWESTAGVAPLNTSSGDWYPAHARHDENVNTVMFDGHVESLSGFLLLSNKAAYCNPCMKAYGDGSLAIRTF